MHVILEAGGSSQLRAFYAFVRMQAAMTRGSEGGSWGRARMKQGQEGEGRNDRAKGAVERRG